MAKILIICINQKYMSKNAKILTRNKFKILDMMLPIYKTNNGIQMIKINNTFYNIYDTNNINKIKDQLLLDKKYESEYIFIQLFQMIP